MCRAISVYSQQFQRTSPTLLLSTDICVHFQDIHHGLLQLFVSAHSGTVCINLGNVGAMAYSHSGQPLLTPRAFGVVDDIFCIFEGILDNVAVLRQRYGLNKSTDEVAIIIEAYQTLRDRGPYHADEVVRDQFGKFAFVLYDSTSEALFTAADADDLVPFFWGTAADDYLVISNEPNVLKEGGGKYFAPFPRGCYFSTSGGLQSFEHPLNKLMPMPRVDSAFGNRRISSSGWVESSHGKLITNTSQEFTYDNLMNFQALGEQQIVNQRVATNSKVILEAATGIELSSEVDDYFTLYLDFNSPMAVINVSNALNKNVSIVDSSRTFFSSLNNNQNAGGDDTITSTQQTYNYQSTQGFYSKKVKAINSALGIKSHKAILYLLFKFLQAFESKTNELSI